MKYGKAMLASFVVLIAQLTWAQDGFDDIFREDITLTGPSAPAVDISGEIGLGMRYYLNDEWESQVSALPGLELKVEASSNSLSGTAAFTLDADESGMPQTMTELIDELYIKAFFPFGYLQAGMLKIEWGKGDGTHVIDPLNPLSQSGAIETDIFDMKRAEVMSVMNFYLGERGLLELVYKPFFHPLHVASEGRWGIGVPDVLPMDTKTLEYSQGAARITGALSFLDLGAIYYYGFMSEPGYRFITVFTGTNPYDPADYTTTIDQTFTKAQLLGIEGVAAVGPFTIRTELGYWFTEDSGADIPELYNDRFVYLGGIDLMVPGTNLFFSLQVTGGMVQNYTDLVETDVDRMASFDNTPHTTTLIGAVDLPFAQDRMKLRVSGLYLVQAKGYLLLPEFTWNIKDDLELAIRGQIFGGEENDKSPYYIWDDNDNIGVSVTYKF